MGRFTQLACLHASPFAHPKRAMTLLIFCWSVTGDRASARGVANRDLLVFLGRVKVQLHLIREMGGRTSPIMTCAAWRGGLV